jgi:hypothetical protein
MTINAEFSYREQSEVFIRAILNNNAQINESNKVLVKTFLITNDNYSFYENKTNKTISDVFEKVANQSIALLNEDVYEGGLICLRYFNLTNEFAYIQSYFDYYENDTGKFVTSGERSSSFTTADIEYFRYNGFNKFYTKSDGRLGAQTYFNVEICTDCDYYISADGKTINVQNGRFNLKDKSFTSDSPYVINVKENNAYEVVGTNIIGINPENSEIIFKANGNITVETDDHRVLGEDTYYQQYKNNQPIFDITTKEKTDLYTTNHPINLEIYDYGDTNANFDDGGNIDYSPCENTKTSCVYWNPANNGVEVNIKNNNLEIKDTSYISYLDVPQIKGENSKFTYYNEEGILEFTESAVTEKGDHDLFPPYTTDITEKGKQYSLISDSGSINTCSSPCVTTGSVENEKGEEKATSPAIDLPDGPRNKVDSVLVITVNPFEGMNTVNKSKKFYVMGRYVEENVRSELNSAIPVYSTSEAYNPSVRSNDKFVMNPGQAYKFNGNKQIPNPSMYKNTVVIITGHHRLGDTYIYGENHYFADELADNVIPIITYRVLSVILNPDIANAKTLNYLDPQNLPPLQYNPNVQVVMFSACNTVTNPKNDDDNAWNAYSRPLIFNLTKSYPNLRLIIGYDNIAPGRDFMYDSYLNKSVTEENDPKKKADLYRYLNNLFIKPGTSGLLNFTLLENGGFEEFGNHAIDLYKINIEGYEEYLKKELSSSRAADVRYEALYHDRYEFSKRVAFYYKAPDGKWYFYRNYDFDHTRNTWVRQPVKQRVNTGQFVTSE